MSIKRGDIVVCISTPTNCPDYALHKDDGTDAVGRMFRVEYVVMYHGWKVPALILSPDLTGEHGALPCSCSFKKVKPASEDIFKLASRPAPVKELA